jgi:acetyl esterase/lipase
MRWRRAHAKGVRRPEWSALILSVALLAAACSGSSTPSGSGVSVHVPGDQRAEAPVEAVPTPPPARDVLGVAYGTDPAQVLDLHLPAGYGPYPVILFLHSGGWLGGSREYIPDFLLAQVARGAAVVSLDHRLAAVAPDGSPVNAFPAANEDVDQAIRFVRANAATWNLDPATIVVSGASAGGHLAAMAAAAPGVFVSPSLPAELRSVSPAVQGVMDFVGPSDLAWLAHNGVGYVPALVGIYLGCPQGRGDLCDDAVLQAASPQSYLWPGVPPAFFGYGADDGAVPPASQGIPLAQQWAAARGESSTDPAAGGGVQLVIAPTGHNLDATNFDVAAMEAWLDAVFAGTLR